MSENPAGPSSTPPEEPPGPYPDMPDLGLPERYAFAPGPPRSIGWWSEPDGTDPPAAAQRPLASDAAPERALRLPVLTVADRAPVAFPAPHHWPIPEAPFAFLLRDEYFGSYLGPYLHEYVYRDELEVSYQGLAGGPVHGPVFDDFPAGAAMQWLHKWHSFVMTEKYEATITLSWIARLLSIIHWSVQPRLDGSPGQYDSGPNHAPSRDLVARLAQRCIIVGGGNLHAMICLAWYAVVDTSRRLSAALRGCPERLPGHRGTLGIDAPLRDALAGLGAVPAYPLAAWSQRVEALSAPYPVWAWGSRRPLLHARAQCDVLRGLYALAGGESKDRARLPSSLAGRVRAAQWDFYLQRNIDVYGEFSLRALRSTVAALRLLLHVGYRCSVFYGHIDAWDPRDPPIEWVPVLDVLAGAPVHRLHTAFDEFARRASLPRAVLWELEAGLHRHAVSVAGTGVREYWGVPDDRPDSFDRAGAVCPNGSYYIRIPLVPAEPGPSQSAEPGPSQSAAPDPGQARGSPSG